MSSRAEPARFSPGSELRVRGEVYWPRITLLALALIGVVGARVHEVHPILWRWRPALLIAVIGGAFALSRTSASVIRRAMHDRAFRLCAAYVVWAAVTVPLSLYPGGSLDAIQGLLPALVVLLVILMCRPGPSVLERLLRGFVVLCTLTAAESLITGRATPEGRLTGVGSFDPNDLAAVCAMAVPLALGLVTRDRGHRKVLWASSLALLLFVLVKTNSRGGFVALGIATLVFVAGQPGRRRLIGAATCVVAAVTFWTLAPNDFRERMRTIRSVETDYNYSEYNGRRMVWKRAIGYTMRSPIFGVGIGAFPVAEGLECGRIRSSGCRWTATHNAYLQAASELGIPGLLLFLAIVGSGVRRSLRLWRSDGGVGALHRPELFAALLGWAVAAIFLSHAYFYLSFSLIALIAYAEVTAQRMKSAATQPVIWPEAAGTIEVRRRPGMRGGLQVARMRVPPDPAPR